MSETRLFPNLFPPTIRSGLILQPHMFIYLFSVGKTHVSSTIGGQHERKLRPAIRQTWQGGLRRTIFQKLPQGLVHGSCLQTLIATTEEHKQQPSPDSFGLRVAIANDADADIWLDSERDNAPCVRPPDAACFFPHILLGGHLSKPM